MCSIGSFLFRVKVATTRKYCRMLLLLQTPGDATFEFALYICMAIKAVGLFAKSSSSDNSNTDLRNHTDSHFLGVRLG